MQLARSRFIPLLVAAVLWSASTSAGQAQTLFEDPGTRLTADGGTFGGSLALDRDVALIGAYADDDVAPLAGAAYIFRTDGSTWTREQKLTASDGEETDTFGQAVALDGDVAIVGSISDDDGGSNAGAAYVFRYDGMQWVEEQKLTASDASGGHLFGLAVAVSGDVAVVGSNADADRTGAAYVYRYDGTQWLEEQKLTAFDAIPDARFGTVLAMDGDRILVAAPSDNDEIGAVYDFRYDGADWNVAQKIVADDPEKYSVFGTSMSLDDDRLLIGAHGADDSRGAAYVFEFDGTEWGQVHRLVANDAAGLDFFGSGVALDGDIAAIGAFGFDEFRGSTYVFRFDQTGWVEQQKIVVGGNRFDRFGWTLALDGEILMSCASGEGAGDGAVYSFFAVSCLSGTVNAATGDIMDALYVHASSGGADRVVEVSESDVDLMLVTVLEPAGGGNGKFVLQAHVGMPSDSTISFLPLGIGKACFPFLVPDGSSPVIVANNIGKTNLVGESSFYGAPTADPDRATTTLLLPMLPIGTELTFQAILVDPSAASPRGVSVTNGVMLRIVP